MDLAGSIAGLLSPWLGPAAAALVARLVSVAITVVVLVILYRFATRLAERLVTAADAGRAPRVRTIGSLLVNVTRWALAFVVLVVVLRELGVDVQALLVSAGLVGVAVGFGAQTLVRDLLTGIFLLFEGLIAVGDVVEAGGRTGTVESIGMRVTRFRMTDGSLRVLPNGQLGEFVNYTSGWAVATVDIAVPRDVEIGRALATLERVGAEWAHESGVALQTPRAQGIIKLTGSDAVLRLTARVDPARRFDAEAELRRRIKEAFDREHWALGGAS
jgi:small conductance mechanosensitive channel